MTRARAGLPTGVLAVILSFAASVPNSVAAESRFEGKYSVGVAAERKKCTSRTPAEYDNDIDVTFLDLVLTPKARKDLSFGLEQGNTHTDTARRLCVSIKFVNDMVRLKRETGGLEPKPQGNPGRGKLSDVQEWVRRRKTGLAMAFRLMMSAQTK